MTTSGAWMDLLIVAILAAAVAAFYRLSVPAPALADGYDDSNDDPDDDSSSSHGSSLPIWLRSRFPMVARQAGFDPGTLRWLFWLAKIAFGVGLPLLVLEFWPSAAVDFVGLAVATSAAVGFFLPDVWLRLRRRARQRQIRRSLSFALDLLVALLRSGIGLEDALRRVAAEGLERGHPLARELSLVGAEIDAGRERTEAFGTLAQRTGVVELRAVAAALRLAARHGLSVNAALETQADLLRTKRRENARAEIAAAATKAIFPVFLCGFPVFLVIVFFPALLELVETLRFLLGRVE